MSAGSNKAIYDNLKSEFEKLINLKCWAVSAGVGTGSHVTMNFGGMLQKKKPLKNPYISELARSFDGEYCVFIEECSWRLESDEKILCGSMSSNEHDGEMVKGLEMLSGQYVTKLKIDYPSMDLMIEFRNSLRLVLFCNTLRIEDGDNYAFFTPKSVFVIQGLGLLDIEKKRARLELI